jgi:hypothetical protein
MHVSRYCLELPCERGADLLSKESDLMSKTFILSEINSELQQAERLQNNNNSIQFRSVIYYLCAKSQHNVIIITIIILLLKLILQK